ncbi:MAG: tRNA pseudouridine(55) synthase TruB [Sporolactobacillus sp.]
METEYNGILPLNKPLGITSHDCVFRLRKMLHFRKIGHTGTLDPEADGVLVVCLGRATRIAEFLLSERKSYRGVVSLGRSTVTEDASGETTAVRALEKALPRARVEEVLRSLTGRIKQVTPLYSAVKVNGKKLYEYARANLPVDPPVREVTIYSLKLENPRPFYEREIAFEVSCSKGTYVRTLAVAIGQMLGYPAHLSALTRTAAGAFQLSDCADFATIARHVETGRFGELLHPLEDGLKALPSWTVDERCAQKIAHGALLPVPPMFDDQPRAVYNSKGHCLAIYQLHPDDPQLIKPIKVLC